ncbi:MAG: hypothetical protein AB7K24_20285 [Gemmataceae bacterium]
MQPARGEVSTEIRLQPRVGQPRVLDLSVSAATGGDWRWHVEGPNQLQRVRRLSVREAVPLLAYLGTQQPLDAVSLLAMPASTTEWWRLVFAEPLREAVVIHGAQSFPARAEKDGLRWAVPLVGIEQADPLEGEVILHLDGVEATAQVRHGLWEGPGARQDSPSPWHAYRYSQPAVALELVGKPSDQVPDTTAGPFVEDAELTTTVDPAGRLLSHLRFRIWNWRQRLLPLMLPAGARCVAALADDSWVEHVPAPVQTEDGVRIDLPIAGPGVHEIEIVYEVATPAWKLWSEVSAPLPKLPARVLSLRRTWRLPPGMTPLVRERYEQLPGAVDQDAGTMWNRPYLTPQQSLERLGAFTGWWNLRTDSVRVHPADLADACAAVARGQTPGRLLTLGESLVRVLEQMPVRQAIVVDAEALERQELTPAIVLAVSKRPPQGQTPAAQLSAWTDLGLICVPAGQAFVLTTRKQLDRWLREGSAHKIPDSLEEAVAAAVRHGHDPSGRFRSVPDWLRAEEYSPPRPGNAPGLERFDFGSNWLEWEPRADHLDDAGILVVRRDLFPTLGLVLAAILGWIAWRSRRWSRALRSSLLWCWIAAGGVALLWLPEAASRLAWYPLLVGLVVVLVSFLRSTTRRARASAAAAALVVATVVAPSLHSQLPPGTVYPVYLLPAEEGKPDEQKVWAPPELIERLEKMADRPGMRGAVLIGASYHAKVKGNIAEFDARFQVHCFAQDKASVTIPLGANNPPEARVKPIEQFLRQPGVPESDKGKPVALEALKQGGFALEVPAGRHEILMRFQVDVSANGPDRSLGFVIPELTESRLELEVPAGARSLFAAYGRGRQVVNPEIPQEAPADKPLRLEADLGRIRNLQVRWRDDAKPQHGILDVREAYLWKLNPSASSLFAVLQYKVEQGAATSFAFDLPEMLDVRSVEAASVPGAAASEQLPRLVDWGIDTKNGRRLIVTFQHPITTGVQIGLELVPRGPLGPGLLLPVPRPLQIRKSDGYLAYRGDGLQIRHVDSQRVTGVLPDRFAEVWKGTGMPDPGPQIFAFTFDRVKGAPVVQLELSVPGASVTCKQQLNWQVGAHQADLSLTAQITSSDTDLLLLEWEMPETVRGVEVNGADVRNWSRSGSRVQVWLERPVRTTQLKLSGWQQLDETRKKLKLPDRPLLRLQPIRLRHITSQTTYLTLSAEPGVAVQPELVKGLLPLPALEPQPRQLAYFYQLGDFAASFAVVPAPVRADTAVLGFVELVDDELIYHSLIDCDVERADRRTLLVSLRNWHGGNVRLETPAGIEQRRGFAAGGSEQVWTVTLPEVANGLYRLKLTGRIPLRKGAPLLMPDVNVTGSTKLQRYVAVAGRELRVENPQGLQALPAAARTLAAWPAEAERIRRAGTAWRIEQADWRLVLVPTQPTLATPFRIFLDEQSAALLDGQRWLHEASYWLYHDSGADLAIELPAGAQLLAVTVDDAEVTRIQTAPDRLWLPLSSRSGAFTLKLFWAYADASETLTRPRLDRPKLEGVGDPGSTTLWTCHVPIGYRPVGGLAQDDVGTHMLRRTEALLELSSVLSTQARGGERDPQLLQAQVDFYRNLRRAEQALGIHQERVKQLRERNLELARTGNFQSIRERAEQQARLAGAQETRPARLGIAPLFGERGTPVYLSEASSDAAPRLTILSLQGQRTRRNFELTVLFLVLLGTLVGVGLFPAAVAWQRRLWPEQMIVLGCLGWLALGPGWLFVFLVVLGVCGRLMLILAGTWRLLQRLAPQPPTTR